MVVQKFWGIVGVLALLVCTAASAQLFDFGDAPFPYPVLNANDGARHIISPFFIGSTVDNESDGQPHPLAFGDDFGGVDDENGIFFVTPLQAGQPATIRVESNAEMLMSGWIDFNDDGDWNDVGEQVIDDEALNVALNFLNFTVPENATPTDTTFARFRASTQANLGVTGAAPDGEVQDVLVEILPAPVCGNGVKQFPPEHCDDGNTDDGDGCSSTCQIEFQEVHLTKYVNGLPAINWQFNFDFKYNNSQSSNFDRFTNITGEESVIAGVIGQLSTVNITITEIVQPGFTLESFSCFVGEQEIGMPVASNSWLIPNLFSGQKAFCEFYNTRPTFCGDGVVQMPNDAGTLGPQDDGNEECDDGNQNNNDGCSNECIINCEDSDNDGVCNDVDTCSDTPQFALVDPDGCSQAQFCSAQAQCGPTCDNADWQGNNQIVQYINGVHIGDCQTVMGHQNGIPIPMCVPVLVCSV